jgi:hypothetical protein
MSYVDIVICVGPLPILETWPPIYRAQERTVRDRLKASQVDTYVYFRYTPCLTDFPFEFIRHPIPPILSPSYWTFVELTLVNGHAVNFHHELCMASISSPGVSLTHIKTPWSRKIPNLFHIASIHKQKITILTQIRSAILKAYPMTAWFG